jgi:hypothetical protein
VKVSIYVLCIYIYIYIYICVCVCVYVYMYVYIYVYIYMPYILESNPHPFYSFRGLKKPMRIRFAVESWILGKR